MAKRIIPRSHKLGSRQLFRVFDGKRYAFETYAGAYGQRKPDTGVQEYAADLRARGWLVRITRERFEHGVAWFIWKRKKR